MQKKPDYLFLLALIVTPVLIYLYFLHWKTHVIYGDDVSIFLYQTGLHNLGDKIDMDVAFQKFRPVRGLAVQLLITLFKKNVGYYYLFNIGIQTINTFIFARILNLFLRSRWLSLGCGLIIGISRLSFFNITQLFNGGALEGLAISFFLLSLFFIVNVFARDDLDANGKTRSIVLGILFANLAMYTHERYIVLFPFIVLAILAYPGLKELAGRQRMALIVGSVASVLLNVAIKKWLCSIPFFVGTAGTTLSFSFFAVLSFFRDAVLSIIEVNTGPGYLVGISFSYLPFFDKLLVVLLVCSILTVTVLWLKGIGKAYRVKENDRQSPVYLLILLGSLFLLFLAPAVLSIRLEQRWLQASFAIFILMGVIVLSDWQIKHKYIKRSAIVLIMALFIITDHHYLSQGGQYLYMAYSEDLALRFKEAMDQGKIRPDTRKLYIWEKQRDLNGENAIRWDLGNGGIFEIYQGKAKELMFTDSPYDRSFSFPPRPFPGLDHSTKQILYLNDSINDITGYFGKDSLDRKVF
jgi:hypothetical protein